MIEYDEGPGVPVTLPNGQLIPDGKPTVNGTPVADVLMAPVADLTPVANAGRRLRKRLNLELSALGTGAVALSDLVSSLGQNVGFGGKYDYQRGPGSLLTGFQFRSHFWHVSNFNVGLFCQQAGLTLDATLTIAGRFARLFSKNAKLAEPYGLDPTGRYFIEKGFSTGESGVYGRSTPLTLLYQSR